VVKVQPRRHLTLKGQKMAESMAAFLLMRYFFPEDRNQKKTTRSKEDFLKDMSFRLETGAVTHTIDKFLK
jgi:hypothetical protein